MDQPDFDCGFRPNDLVRIPRQGTGKRADGNRGTVVSVDMEVKTSLSGRLYQMVVVKDLQGKKNTWASTVLVKA